MSYEIAGRVGWLVSLLDHWRGRPNEADSDQGESADWRDQSLLSRSEGDEDRVTEDLAAKHLREAVEHLPPRERQILLLHVNSGLTYWEIADRLGIAEQVVLGDLSHAYSQLRVELSMDDLRS